MLKRYSILLISVCFSFVAVSQGWRPKEMEVRISVNTTADLDKIFTITHNIEPASPDGHYYRGYLIPEELEKLKTTGIVYEVTIPDLNLHYKHFWDNPLVPPGYYTYEQIIAIADSLAANFPSICKKEIWGTSVGGRQLAALKISDNAGTDENEAEILFDGGIHGDEVGGSQNVIMFARELCLKYGTDPIITGLVDDREILLLLMVNPDGRVSMSRYNQNGVDCNRDNGYMWDGEGFSPSAVSQIETKTLRNALLNNQFTCYTNYHSGTEIISYPWSYRTQSPRDLLHIDILAAAYSSTTGYPGGMQYGQGYNVMYAINGSTKDFVYGSLGNVGWSVEISMDKQPPSSQIQYYYDVNKPAMLEIIKQCGWGAAGTVTDSLTGAPVSASVWINNYFPVYTDPVVGDYHKFMATGTYSMTVTANGYKSKTVSGIVVPSQGTVTTNFQLTPDTGWYASKVTSCRIPGNNFGDEGYTPGCIGKPDGIPYAMGRNGWITLDMGDTLYNGPGMDFKVFQSGTTNKSFTVSGSLYLDGPYTTIGTGSGTTSFDLPSQLGKLRYLYIKDNGTGSSTGTGAGFNLDAVAMITPPLRVAFSADNQSPCAMTSINFTDQSAGNPVSWEWSFPGGTPSSSNLQNPTGITYNAPGSYPVTLTISNGVSSLTRTQNSYISVASSPVPVIGNDTLICDDDQITLDAGPGFAYLWSTGASTPTITVDSTGTGYGTAIFWVLVTGSNGCTGSDTIHVTFDECTGISDSRSSAGISVFPNPVISTSIVKINGMNGGRWRILDQKGMMIRSGAIATKHEQFNLDMSEFPAGLMILVAENENFILTRKIMVVKP